MWAHFILICPLLALALPAMAQQLDTSSARPHYLDRYKPVLVYTLDEAVDNEALESLSAQIHAPAGAKPPVQIAGARDFTGKAWDFQETAASFLATPREAGYRLGDIKAASGMSVSFWMKADWRGVKNNHRVMGYAGLDVVVDKGRGKGLLYFSMGGYSLHMPFQQGQKLFDNEWHHVVLAVDFRSREENIVIYADGLPVVTGSGATAQRFNATHPRYPLYLGARSNGSYPFNGALDDVAFFDYALSPKQVAAIAAGPVFAGVPQVVYLPNAARLDGIVPQGISVKWRKRTGPGDVTFDDPSKRDAQARFMVPGDYVLVIQPEGLSPAEVEISVRPVPKPAVVAGDPIRLDPTQLSTALAGRVSVLGQKHLVGVTMKWSKVDGPGSVSFSSETSLETEAIFSKPGLYRLRLSAQRSGMSDADEVTVLLSETAAEHYALPLGPLYLFPLDEPANRLGGGIADAAGGTVAELARAEDFLPLQSTGARPFTGRGWDFTKSQASLRVHNRFNVARLGHITKTSGMSFSFWVRGKDFVRQFGYIGGAGYGRVMEVRPSHFGTNQAGIEATVNGVVIRLDRTTPNAHLFDGRWHHIVLVADFREATDNIKLYVDGGLSSTISHTFSENFHGIRTDHSNFWAARPNGGGDSFKGELDDIIAFDRPITEAEVAYLFNGPSSAGPPLTRADAAEVHAGEDQIFPLPAQAVQLKASIDPPASGQGVSIQWRLVQGPGQVVFTSPDQAQTQVRFEPLGEGVHNPDYRRYVFAVTTTTRRNGLDLIRQDETSVVLYKPVVPKTRQLSKTPPPGVHPRILFAPEDLAGMRKRAKSDPVAIEAIKAMQQRYAAVLFDPNSQMGFTYHQLLNGEQDVWVKDVVSNGVSDVYNYTTGEGNFYGKMCGAAFLALIQEDAKAKELAMVLSNCAKEHLKYYRPNYGSYLTHDASGALGLAYDFLYNEMSEAQREPVRKLLSRMTHWRQSKGTGMTPPDNSTNWRTFHDHILIASLAIEGEEGYDPAVYEQTRDKLRDFLTQYGVFPSGYAHEGWGYFDFGMISGALTSLAVSRRDENLYETTNLYRSLLAGFYSMPPGMDHLLSHGDTVTGKLTRPGNQVWIGRYLWPNDPAIQALGNTLAGKLLNVNDKRPLGMMAVMFATGERLDAPPQQTVANKLDLPLTLFCPDTGHVNTRSGWGDDATMLSFRCRMDKYFLGHMHPDVNAFELFSHGVEWFTDPGKFFIPNDTHQTVLIDGLGAGGSTAAWTWPSLPGKLVAYKDAPLATLAAGDAKAFYDYVIHKPQGILTDASELVQPEQHGLRWSDFVFNKTRHDPMPVWRQMPLGQLWTYNPVQKAYRTAVMIRGAHPYAVIIDDIQKDDRPHDYQWVANGRPGSLVSISAKGGDLLLRPKDEAKKDARLLVRSLRATGQAIEPVLVNRDLVFDTNTLKTTQVLIDAKQTLEPEFKVLLYPHNEGEHLPVTTWLDRDTLEVAWGEQKDVWRFKRNGQGRTRVSVSRNGTDLLK